MGFKEWLKQCEDVNLGGLEPPQERPVDLAALGAMPRYDDAPLPGNKKAMHKAGESRKKFRIELRKARHKD